MLSLLLMACDLSTVATDCAECSEPPGDQDTDTAGSVDTGSDDAVRWLMLQHAESVAFDVDDTVSSACAELGAIWSGELTLLEVDDETLWFSERPDYVAFEMATAEYVELFDTLFGDVPPNAVVSWEGPGGGVEDHVVEVQAPTLSGDDLTYGACGLPITDAATGEVVAGQEPPDHRPAHTGSISLFIDDAPDAGAHAGEEEDEDPTPVYVAFSGGGWHSHSAMAGWFAGLLDARDDTAMDAGVQDICTTVSRSADGAFPTATSTVGWPGDGDTTVADLTTHVQVLGANSGGSWFLTQLAWSGAFLSGLEDGRNAYTTDGYLGETRTAFGYDDAEGDETASDENWVTSYYRLMSKAGSTSGNWSAFVHDVVYGPLEMSTELASTTLGTGTRNGWAEDRDVVVAASLLTDKAVLTADSDSYWSYDQYVSVAPTAAGATSGQNFTPLTFSSIGTSWGSTTPVFRAGELEGTWRSMEKRRMSATATVSGDPAIDAVVVMDATVASSSAAGAAASLQALTQMGYGYGSSTTAYHAADMAAPITIDSSDDGDVISFPASGTIDFATYDELAEDRALRTADGGYLDNTALAYVMGHLADHGKLSDGTELVLFMNSSSVRPAGVGLPESAAVLFGYNPHPAGWSLNDDGTVGFCLAADTCVKTPSAQVFASAAGKEAEATWSWDAYDVDLSYFELAVTTVDNALFGVPGDVELTLHLFVSEDFSSNALPSDASIMNSYTNVYDVTRCAVRKQGGQGWLEHALQLD